MSSACQKGGGGGDTPKRFRRRERVSGGASDRHLKDRTGTQSTRFLSKKEWELGPEQGGGFQREQNDPRQPMSPCMEKYYLFVYVG